MLNLVETLTHKYFNHFSNKNLDEISAMFSKHIELVDWSLNEKGIKNVTKAYKNIFDGVISIRVIPYHIYVDDLTAIAQIKIDVETEDGVEILEVVDIIQYDEDAKIRRVTAYKR